MLRYGAYGPEVLERLRWMGDVLGPLLREAVRRTGPVDVTGILTQMLQMGDEAHNRNRAGTLMLLRDLAPSMVGRPASTAVTCRRRCGSSAATTTSSSTSRCRPASWRSTRARDVPGSTMVVAMARNGTDFGIQVSGTGDEWFTGPAQLADGLFLGDYGPDDANPDIGDSAITETAGIGGFAMATAPAIVRFVGGTVPDALATTRRMREITLTENPRWSVPVLDFAGVPTGIDVTRVCRTGILPQINTGMAGKRAGVGQVGAGLVTPPAEIFPKALARLAELAAELRSTGRPPLESSSRRSEVAHPAADDRRRAECRAGRTRAAGRRCRRAASGWPPRGRPAAPRPGGWAAACRSTRTTRHHGTGPPCAAMTEPT